MKIILTTLSAFGLVINSIIFLLWSDGGTNISKPELIIPTIGMILAITVPKSLSDVQNVEV